MTELTSFLHAQHSLNRSELEAERTARTRLKDQLKSASSRQRKAEEKVLEQSLQLSRLLKQIDDSARETHESRRKAAEHYERAVQRLERENLDLRRKEEESGKRVMEMMNADVSMKSTITNLKKQVSVLGSSGLRKELPFASELVIHISRRSFLLASESEGEGILRSPAAPGSRSAG